MDLVRAAIRDPGARAAELARDPAGTVPADASLERVVGIMSERFTPRLLVIDPPSGAVAGVVSAFDVVAVLGSRSPRVARMLRPAPARPAPSAGTLEQTQAEAVMHAGIATSPADAPLRRVAEAMAEHRTHCVAVAGSEPGTHRLTWGLITDMDLVLAAHRGGLAEPAATIAATAPLAVDGDAPLDQVAALMVANEIRHIVVTGRSGLPAGMISTLDVARVIAVGAP
jgi:CBS domain-containing protein